MKIDVHINIDSNKVDVVDNPLDNLAIVQGRIGSVAHSILLHYLPNDEVDDGDEFLAYDRNGDRIGTVNVQVKHEPLDP